MSLTIDKNLIINNIDTGILMGFHKVTEVHIFRHEQRAVVTLSHYKAEANCDTNCGGSMSSSTYTWMGGQFPFTKIELDIANNNVYKIAESKIKADGIDIFGFNWSNSVYVDD